MNTSTLHAMKSFKTLLFLAFFSFSAFGWGQVNITPIRTDVSGFSTWTDTNVAGTTYLQLLVADANTISPSMNFDLYSSETLDFKARTYGGTTAAEIILTVWISTNNGTDWTNIGTRTPSSSTLTSQAQFDLSGYSGSQVKVKFSVAGTSNNIGVGIDDITIRGVGSTITTSASLNSFTTTAGTASAAQTYTVSGDNLTESVVVTAPIDFEVSTDGTNYSSSVSLAQSGGNLTGEPVTIHVRIKASATVGSKSGNITHTSNGATAQNVAVSGTVNSNEPEINIKQGSTEYASGATYDFGNVRWGSYSEVTFTIENQGNSDLTITTPLSGSGTYTIETQPISPVSGPSGTTSFVVRFTPNAIGTLEGSVSITNNDTSENPYVINFTGTGKPSADSHILVNSSFITPTNIPYINYVNSSHDITYSNSLEVGQFIVYDGDPNTGDADNLPTDVTSITFAVTAASNIDRIALYDGTNEISEVAGSHPISFSGLVGVTIPDNSSKTYSIRVLFKNVVTDNVQIKFSHTLRTAVATSSSFVSSDSGQATSIIGDDNRIEVVADRLSFSTQPQNQNKDVNLATFAIAASDLYDNKDLDIDAQNIILTTSGVNMTADASYTMNNGLLEVSNVSFSSVQTGITLTATTTGLSFDNDVVSSAFDITEVALGSFRTTTNGIWSSSSGNNDITWEEFTSSGWSTMTSPTYPATNTSNAVFIKNVVTLNGTFSASDVTVENGGVLSTNTVGATFTDLLVKNGGIFNKQANGVKINGTIEVEDGGTFTFVHTNNTSRSTNIWKGTEKFHTNSNFIIYETENTSNFLVIENQDDISDFEGGCFGNIIVDFATGGGKLQLLPSPYSKTLAKGNLIFRTAADNIKFSSSDFSAIVKGNLLIEDTFNKSLTILQNNGEGTLTVEGDFYHQGSSDFRLCNSSSSNTSKVTMNINGDIFLDGSYLKMDIGTSTGPTIALNLDGDLNIMNGVLSNTNNNYKSKFNFSGSGDGLTPATTQSVDFATTDTSENKNIDFFVNNGAYVQLSNNNFNFNSTTLTIKTGGIFDNGGSFQLIGASGTNALNVDGTFITRDADGFNGSDNTTIKLTNAPSIALNIGSTVDYAGANQTITPYNYKKLQTSGSGIKTLALATGVIVEEDLTAYAARLWIETGKTLTVNGKINNNTSGDDANIIEVAHTGSLLQTNTGIDANTGTGNYKIQKTTGAFNNYDYFFWVSPIANVNIETVFPLSDTNGRNRRFKYVPENFNDTFSGTSYNQLSGSPDGYDDNNDDWTPISDGTTMSKGLGFIVMGKGAAFPFAIANAGTALTPFSVNFKGSSVNNGEFTVPLYQDSYSGTLDWNQNLNLIGNPYPSAIDIKKLYDVNKSALTGNFYFWTHATAIAANGGPNDYDFVNSNYATGTITGSSEPYTYTNNTFSNNPYIASGQGFMAAVKENGNLGTTTSNLTYNNSMRVPGENNTFLRLQNNNQVDRLWLMLSSETGVNSQIAIGFSESTSDAIGQGDAPRLDSALASDFYSLIPDSNESYSIQFLGVFDTEKTVPLGAGIQYDGTYQISLTHSDGVFLSGQTIYLEDTYQDIIHDLSASAYTFTQEAGENINDRFVLRFTNSALSNEETALNEVKVYPNPSVGVFNIAYYGSETLQYTVYDVTGKKVLDGAGNQINLAAQTNGIYLAKVTDGKSVKTLKLVREN